MVEAIVQLLAGLGSLLVGFKLLSDNIEKLANSGLKKLFSKTSNNRMIGVGIGAAATALVQSSGATTIMIVGFVNAGIMTLFQATAMIMGANIGTTITAQIVALGAIDVSLYAMLLAFAGMFVQMLFKKDKIKTIGLATAGLGLVFISLELMSGAMSQFVPKQGETNAFTDLLSSVNNPFLLLLIGAGITTLLQSSSASTAILITMVGAGLSVGTTSNGILFVILGANIGSTTTALLSSFGASTNARRASIIHLLFNVFGSLVLFVMLICWPNFMDVTFKSWFPGAPGTQIAMFHTFFNVSMTLLFVPFINVFVKVASFLVPDKKEEKTVTYLDERFLESPTVAIEQVTKEVVLFGELSMETLNVAIDAFVAGDLDKNEVIFDNIKKIDEMNKNILSYMVKLSSKQSDKQDEQLVSVLHHTVNDIYREAEIAFNMTKYTKHLVEDSLVFSDNVFNQIKELKEKLNAQFKLVADIISTRNMSLISSVDAIEDEIDSLRSTLIQEHIDRLERGECSPASSGVYINLVSNLERAGDHLHYIAHNFTGDNVAIIEI